MGRVYSLGFGMSRKSVSFYLWMHLSLLKVFFDSPCPAHTHSVFLESLIFLYCNLLKSLNSFLCVGGGDSLVYTVLSVLPPSSYLHVIDNTQKGSTKRGSMSLQGTDREPLGFRDQVCQQHFFLFQKL